MDRPMIRSGNVVIDTCFGLCVNILLWLADLFGVSYNTINIWIFCIIWPVVTVVLLVIVVRQHIRIRRFREMAASIGRGADTKQWIVDIQSLSVRSAERAHKCPVTVFI